MNLGTQKRIAGNFALALKDITRKVRLARGLLLDISWFYTPK